MGDAVEVLRRSRDYQRDRVKQVKKARNQNADGLEYWRGRAAAAEAALKAVEFRGHQGKCPLCAGWMMSAYGETPGKHTKDCLVGKALKAEMA